MRWYEASMKKAIILIATVFIIAFCSALPVWANITLSGDGADRNTFVGMLNTFSTGGTWTASEGVLSELTFTPTSGTLNNFAQRLNYYNAQNDVLITLHIIRNSGGVVAGAFRGGGVQHLDLDDILMFPASINDNRFPVNQAQVLDLQSAVIIHEVHEVFNAVQNLQGEVVSHAQAVGAENGELDSRGSRGVRRNPPDTWRRNPPETGPWELVIPWAVKQPNANVTFTNMIITTTANNITNIRSGLVNTGEPYDGTEQDIRIERLYVESEEIPTAITLSSFTAEAKESKVALKWETGIEIDNVGFNILRSESENGNYAKINKKLITAKGSTTKGAEYSLVDKKVKSGKTYYYKLEDIDRNGTSTLHGPKSVKVSFKKKGKGKK